MTTRRQFDAGTLDEPALDEVSAGWRWIRLERPPDGFAQAVPSAQQSTELRAWD